MKKCHICGIPRKITMECCRCGAVVCLNDLDVRVGICVDCQVMFYVEKYYGENINDYKQTA